MQLDSIIKQLDAVYSIFEGYRVKCEYLNEMFNKKHNYFFRELNSFFSQTENNYNYLKNNKFYLDFVDKLNSIFDMYYQNNDDKDISLLFNKMIENINEYLLDIDCVVDELNVIKSKLQKIHIIK